MIWARATWRIRSARRRAASTDAQQRCCCSDSETDCFGEHLPFCILSELMCCEGVDATTWAGGGAVSACALCARARALRCVSRYGYSTVEARSGEGGRRWVVVVRGWRFTSYNDDRSGVGGGGGGAPTPKHHDLHHLPSLPPCPTTARSLPKKWRGREGVGW